MTVSREANGHQSQEDCCCDPTTPSFPMFFAVLSICGTILSSFTMAPFEHFVSTMKDDDPSCPPRLQYNGHTDWAIAGTWLYVILFCAAIIALLVDARNQLMRDDGMDRRFTAGTSIVLAAGYIATIGCLIGIVLPELNQLAGENWEDGKEDITSHDFDDISAFLILTAFIPVVAVLLRFGAEVAEDKYRAQGEFKLAA